MAVLTASPRTCSGAANSGVIAGSWVSVRAAPSAAREQLRDAEVEQLRAAVGRHEDVRRLEIAVDDEVLVGVAHRVADLRHELEPAGDRELVLVAVAGERHALDQLHGEVRHARRR